MAGSVFFIARAQARHRWRALVALAVLVGLMGGLSLALIAGSRRSATVVDRFFAAARPYTYQFYADGISRKELLAIPGVERADPGTYLAATYAPRGQKADGGIDGLVVDFGAVDPTNRILDGHVPDRSDLTDIGVNQAFVDQFGVSVGDTVPLQMFGTEQLNDVQNGVYRPDGPTYRFRIAALVRPPSDIALDEKRSLGNGVRRPGIFVNDRWYKIHHREFLTFGGMAYTIQLRDGVAGRRAFIRAVKAHLPAGAEPPALAPVNIGLRKSSLATPVDLETSALLALGIGLAVVLTIAAALVLRAEQRVHDEDTPTFRGLGCTVPQLGSMAIIRMMPVAIGGAVLALLVAVGLSGRFPIGIGRLLELDGGVQINAAVLGLGLLAIIVFTLTLTFVLARPRRVRDVAPTRRLTFARWLGRSGAPVDLTLGAQLAFERGKGVRAVPARAAIVGGAATLAIVTALAIYLGGVDHLYRDPVAHGWPWDAVIGNTNFPLAHSTATKLVHDDQIAHQTASRYGDAKVNDEYTEFLAFDPRGDAPPEVIAGRLPETASEIALGRATLDKLGVGIGSTVTFSVAGGEFEQRKVRPKPLTMRVVGEALAPVYGEVGLGEVGIVTLDAIRAAGGKAGPQLVLVDLQRGSPGAGVAAFDRHYTEEIAIDSVPARIVNLHRVRRVPLLGLLLAGLMGTILLIYTLAISARARARELAVLRGLGLPSKRVRRVLAWQGIVLAVGMLVLGIPMGFVIGTAAWKAVADDLGVANGLILSPYLLLLVPLALAVAVGASLYPSRRARRAPVADVLRVE